jgi:hypothetical protein
MSDFIDMLTTCVVEELSKKEVKDKILQPLLIWFLRLIVPYILLIIFINFFLTIAANCLVLYFWR